MTDTEHPSLARGFLFADLRGYSAFVERHGDRAAADLLAAYRTLVRAAVAEFHGAEIRTEGDSFYVAFDSPSSAVRCGLAVLDAAAAGRGPDGAPIRVGIGIHAGETVQTAEGYVGSAVNIAARVCAVAGPGELLVTDAVRSLTRTYLGAEYRPRGRHRLKGITEPIALFQVTMGPRTAPLGRPDRLDALRRHARLLVGALALVVVLIGGSLVGAALLREAGGGVTSDGSSTSSAGGTPAAAASDALATASLGEYPTAAEQELLDRLPESIPRRTCERATRNLGVSVPFQREPGIMPTLAVVTCDPGSPSAPHVLTYWQADSTEMRQGSEHNWVADAFFKVVGLRGIPQGDCGDDEIAYQSWAVGEVNGSFLCALNPEGDLEIIWTYDDDQIIVSAIRRDNDLGILIRWWEDHRFLMAGAP